MAAYEAQQPMQASAPAQLVNGGDWQHSLFDCTPFTSCIISCCVPCLLLGDTSERMRDPSMQTATPLNNDCLIHGGLTVFTGCGWIYAMMKRTEIRARFGIPGSGTGDCCTAYWCQCCALIQQDNEVKSRLPPGPIQQQYQPQHQAMVMPQGQPQKEKYAQPHHAP
ncbi:PLAC8 family-domain-containing protein [Xylariales sp. AK1849]|nr:PLAC8 family-domain-containing protein [Xylariales sp. AK1849]